MTLVAVFAGTASAKVLPVTDLRVATRTPVAKSPVREILRRSRGSAIGGVAVTRGEVVMLPAGRVDADGWPLVRTDGKTVVLHRVGDGVFRGSFVVDRGWGLRGARTVELLRARRPSEERPGRA